VQVHGSVTEGGLGSYVVTKRMTNPTNRDMPQMDGAGNVSIFSSF